MNKKHDKAVVTGRATIKEVAERANVSQSTVSRALRSPHMVKSETVNAVHAAVKALNYVYNAMAGSLSSRRSDAIGILIPSPIYSAFAINLMSIQELCSERNFSCRIATSQFQPAKELQAMQKFHEQRIAGLIMAGIDNSNIPYLRAMVADGIPTVVLWESPGDEFNYIAMDNFKAAYDGVKYLLALGHERIALLTGPHACARRNYDRFRGYQAVLASHGIPFDEQLVRSQPPTLLHGKESMRAFLKIPNPPTAVLCVNDYLAIGAIRAIHESGLRVPDDISVCGFDDVDISAYFTPPITTIKTPGLEMGRMAGDALMTAIETQTPLMVQYILDAELIIRSSCAPRKTV